MAAIKSVCEAVLMFNFAFGALGGSAALATGLAAGWIELVGALLAPEVQALTKTITDSSTDQSINLRNIFSVLMFIGSYLEGAWVNYMYSDGRFRNAGTRRVVA